jgi:hypothetical protein
MARVAFTYLPTLTFHSDLCLYTASTRYHIVSALACTVQLFAIYGENGLRSPGFTARPRTFTFRFQRNAKGTYKKGSRGKLFSPFSDMSTEENHPPYSHHFSKSLD